MLNHTYAHIVCLNNNEIDIVLNNIKTITTKDDAEGFAFVESFGTSFISITKFHILYKKIMKTTQSKSEPSECMKEKIMTQT